MCNQSNVPSVNLQTAVLMQVQEFVQSGQAFSRYDITKALRQKCNDGLMEIPDVENVNSSPRFDIRKSAVDAIFEQLYQNCLANGLPPLTYAFNQAGGYREFKVDSQAFANSLATVPPSSPVNPTQITSVSNSPASMVSVSMTALSDAEIKRRVALYLDHCSKIGMVPTVKQIQSAIKRGNRAPVFPTVKSRM